MYTRDMIGPVLIDPVGPIPKDGPLLQITR